MDRCGECGFDPDGVTPETAADAVRAFARRYQAPLTRFLPDEDGTAVLRTRPESGGWSALEYAAHVADVFKLFGRRVEHLRATDGAALEVVDHEAAVASGAYDELEPAHVAADIADAANTLGDALAGLTEAEWNHSGTRAGEPRTMLDVARRAVHEGSHHLLDIGRALRAARQR